MTKRRASEFLHFIQDPHNDKKENNRVLKNITEPLQDYL
jgi:hypothetical protein